MSFPIMLTNTSKQAAITATAVDLGATMSSGKRLGEELWLYVADVASWIKQGAAKLVTCVAKASLADTDVLTVTIDGVAVVYEFDTAGDGVTAGRVQVDVSADTTAATVAARLRTALLANQTALEVIDNTDGTLTVGVVGGATLAIAEGVANAGFLVASVAPRATAGSGSAYVPANTPVLVDASRGAQLGALRAAGDGKASLTHCMMVR